MKTEKSLSEWRTEIDSLDHKIIEALQARAKIGKAIGELKNKAGEPVYRPDRERDVYEKVIQENQGPLPNHALVSIYREIMSATINLEKPVVIGYLGPQASFSHEAVSLKFGSSVQTEPFPTIPDVFKAVETGQLEYGMVPVENSTEGLVSSTLDQFLLSDLRIYSEFYLRVSFHLLGYETDLSKVNRIYGIKIGNEQCKAWIAKHLPHAEIVETSSTANAAKIVSERKDGVAIASSLAAEMYGLQKIRSFIEDIPGNSTRFLVINRSAICPPTGKDKTSIVFHIPDKSGSLFSILKIFAENGTSLSKIESRPSRRNLWEYNFFVDFYGHSQESTVRSILEQVAKECTFLKILGSYPTSQVADEN